MRNHKQFIQNLSIYLIQIGLASSAIYRDQGNACFWRVSPFGTTYTETSYASLMHNLQDWSSPIAIDLPASMTVERHVAGLKPQVGLDDACLTGFSSFEARILLELMKRRYLSSCGRPALHVSLCSTYPDRAQWYGFVADIDHGTVQTLAHGSFYVEIPIIPYGGLLREESAPFVRILPTGLSIVLYGDIC